MPVEHPRIAREGKTVEAMMMIFRHPAMALVHLVDGLRREPIESADGEEEND